MIPILPSNPSTISPVARSLKDRLEFLRRLDTYERMTTLERELEKGKIERQLEEVKWTHI